MRLFVVVVALAGMLAGGAQASTAPHTSPKKAIWGPVRVNGVSQFPIYRDLGVGIFQMAVDWSAVAPSRPVEPRDPADAAYAWPQDLDYAVRAAAASGIRINLQVMRTPRWANGARDSNVPPKRLADFADFLEALARRYRSVHLWMIWGEPIRTVNFLQHPTGSPNYYLNGGGSFPKVKAFNRAQRTDARRYSELVDAAYARLKSLSKSNLIIGGNTTTSGDVDPLSWIKNLRLRNGKPPRMDLFGHNPFSSRTPDLRKRQLVPGTADFSDLDLFATWLDRYLARGKRNHHLRIFISEFTLPTDVPSYEFPFHATRAAQARFLSAGLRIARRWERIFTFGWIGLRDAAPRSDGGESRTGLIDRSGVRKPAYFALKRG